MATDVCEERIDRLTAAALEAELQAVAVMPGPNMVYLTGLSFHLSERPVVAFFAPAHDPVLLVPALERAKAEAASFKHLTVTYTDSEGPGRAFVAALERIGAGGKWLGVEGRRIRYLELDLIARTGLDPGIFDADEIFARLRERKDAGEVGLMRRAVAIAEAAFREVLPLVRPGVTEREVAAELTVCLLRGGSEPDLPFAPLVASGPNGANPHGFPSERILEAGDIVTIDWGARYEGYVSDITRNVVVGGAVGGMDLPGPGPDPVAHPHPDLVRAHDVVLRANEAGRAAARPGATGQDVDRAARAVVEEAGLGEYFIHRTGHGIGLEAHEHPIMNEGETAPLATGMAFTVEPGVYIPGIGGVRIEDDMLIVDGGAESLTTLRRELATAG
jgi:Xaa-Pro dipeptidase